MPHFKKYVEIDKINFKNLSKKNQKTECDIMDLNKKILIISMLVMLVCCVSAVSATDINGTDDISDDIIIDENPVDEITDVVEDVNIDDTQDNAVDEGNLRGNPLTVDTTTYTNYFDANGYFNDSSVTDLTFDGNFGPQSYGNFKFNQEMKITSTPGSTFTNVGFDLTGPRVTVDDCTFIFNEPTNINAGLNVTGAEGKILNTRINVTAPENSTFNAIDVYGVSGVKIFNNTLIYNCSYKNNETYNYVIKGKNAADLNITGNTIYAYLPLKKVNWYLSGSIDADYVAGIAVEHCNGAQIIDNTLDVKGTLRGDSFPTLDAIILANSNDVHVEHNTIRESDIVTVSGQASYLYGVDVYTCNNIHIAYNDITMNGNKSGGHIEGNGTGAAYCIQLTGQQGVNIYYNNLTTSNEGPNLAIYSQNYAELDSHLTVYGNNISVTGKAGDDPWSLVSGIETQDRHAEIYNNTIRVNNTAGYVKDTYAFGISYAQWINGTHDVFINNNDVEVINGDYAVYLLYDAVTGRVTNNNLIAYTATGNNTGDDAVFADDTRVHVDN